MKFDWRKFKQVCLFLLRNALSLIFFLYGLKCIVMLHGKLVEPHDVSAPHILHTFKLAPVTGMAAALAGLGYIAIGLFFYVSINPPPDENRTWLWRIWYWIIRWGSLVAVFIFWHEAHKLRISA